MLYRPKYPTYLVCMWVFNMCMELVDKITMLVLSIQVIALQLS